MAERRLNELGFEALEPWQGGSHRWRVRCSTCGSETTKDWGSIKDGRGCVFCKGLRVSHDAAVMTMNDCGFEPLEEYPGTRAKWLCRCRACGLEVDISREQVLGGRRCPYCSGDALTESEAEKIARSAGFEIGELKYRAMSKLVKTDTPVRIRCLKCGEMSRKTIRLIKSGSACKFCSGRAVATGSWEHVPRSKGLAPLEEYPGANTPWQCRCNKCGRTVHPTYSRMASGGSGCAYCSRRRLSLEDVERIFISRNLKLLGKYQRANEPVKCRCLDCGARVELRLSVVQRGGGCPACAPYGINLSGPGFLYLMSHHGLGAFKVGIAKSESRLEVHERFGWRLHRTEHFRLLRKAALLEQRTLALWERRGVYRPLTKQLMPQGGWTETADLGRISIPAEVARMRRWAREIRPKRGRLPVE